MQSTRSGLGHIKHIHFIGIGGSGMCGIAEVLHNEGYVISGSDVKSGDSITRLKALGINVTLGHGSDNINGAEVVVRSTAVADDNPEIIAAQHQRLPIVARAEMLAELMRYRYGIAVAGTHGKTTTTSLVASILEAASLDPTYVIGGQLNAAASNAHLGSSKYFVAEADESDASFLFLKPMMAVVTNIDADHMSTYNNSFAKLTETFLRFLHHLPFYGLAIVGIDDENIVNILPQISRRVLTYGFAEDSDFKAYDYHQRGLRSEFKVARPDDKPLSLSLNLPGKHNVQNALAAIVIASELGVDDNAIIKALSGFQGVGRRAQQIASLSVDGDTIPVIDDYGHHPKEIEVTIEAMRAAFPDRRLILVFEPHRYSRTQELFDDFSNVLTKTDSLIMLPVYAAGEAVIDGANSSDLCRSIRERGLVEPIYVNAGDELALSLKPLLRKGDVLLFQGAGSVSHFAHQCVADLDHELD